MNIMFRDEDGNLFSRAVEDTKLNMSVEKTADNNFVIKLGSSYTLEGTFSSKKDAEDHMIVLTEYKNDSESE